MIGGILLAAGGSRRMGQPKLVLPWKDDRTIIAHMVDLFLQAGVEPIIVVTGADREAIEACLEGISVTMAHNSDHAARGMIESVRVGLRALQQTVCEAVLITPADLPSMQSETLRLLIDEFEETETTIAAPSYEGRRGHPVLISRSQWIAILEMPEGKTLRDFLRRQADRIQHVVVRDPGILLDLDSPEDYDGGLAGAFSP